jgi:hypothetical protein
LQQQLGCTLDAALELHDDPAGSDPLQQPQT